MLHVVFDLNWANFFMDDTGAPDFTLQSLNDDPHMEELHLKTKEPRNLSLQLSDRRLLCP